MSTLDHQKSIKEQSQAYCADFYEKRGGDPANTSLEYVANGAQGMVRKVSLVVFLILGSQFNIGTKMHKIRIKWKYYINKTMVRQFLS